MNKTIMIIEDEKEISSTLRDFLEFEHYDVLTAGNGSEGLKLLAEHEMPNLILLDMKMPVMNGWEFAAAFDEKYHHACPVVVLTAAADAEKRASDISAQGWVAKPFNLDLLLKKIRMLER